MEAAHQALDRLANEGQTVHRLQGFAPLLPPCEVMEMPRPRKRRRVCGLPKTRTFGPAGIERGMMPPLTMTVEEYEAVRLMDREGLTQDQCARQMDVARTTVQRIYAEARQKIATALVDGRQLIIEGGDYVVCTDAGEEPHAGPERCRRCFAGTGRARRRGPGHQRPFS